MLIHLHSQATTTPKVRSAIQASDEPASVLAARYGTTVQTIYKWRHRDSVEDRSHTPHRLQTGMSEQDFQAFVNQVMCDVVPHWMRWKAAGG